MRGRVLCLIALLGGCIHDDLVPCGELLCNIGLVCTADGCATVEEAAACEGQLDDTSCGTTLLPAYCRGGACRASICGDSTKAVNEACDDGNTSGGDGCAAECDSNETCGNDIADFDQGEQCDDAIIGLSSDGCSSTCAFEVDRWTNAEPAMFVPRKYARIAYDTAHDRTMLFGGELNLVPLDDTWTWDGANWRRINVPGPSPRWGHLLVYDEERDVTILFGGSDSEIVLADTWSWDGERWTQLSPASSPPGASLMAAAYDPVRKRILMYEWLHGGTWEWDGATWIQLAPATVPVLTYDPQLVHVAGTSRMMMLGSINGGGGRETWEWDGANWSKKLVTQPPLAQATMASFGSDVVLFNNDQETWSWNGTSWSLVTSAAPLPKRRVGAATTYDTARQRVVMTSGLENENLNDTWEWDGVSWTERAHHTLPSPRFGTPLAYDAGRGVMVMFSGAPLAPLFGDTWEWDGQVWMLRRPTTMPPASGAHGLAYDERRERVIMYGNAGANVWSWDGSDWSATAPIGPRPPAGPMVYDVARDTIMIVTDTFANTPETWTWNGASWQQHVTPSGPTNLRGMGLVYDRARQVVVLFGGFAGVPTNLLTNRTWEWNGASWLERTPAVSPPPREFPTLAYDELRHRVVMFGGRANADIRLADTWEWDGTTWSLLGATPPPARAGAGVAYDAIRARVVVFGGHREGVVPLGDTWAFGYASASIPRDTCTGDSDADADGLVGCADPDCWGRCTPFCRPATICDPTRAHCGDGSCSSIEDPVLCPGDC